MKHPRRGWLDLGDRIARRLLTSPRFRRDAEIVRDHVEPDEAPALVRTLLWTDSGLALSMVGAAPAVINAGIEALRELVVQVDGLPIPAVRAFLDETLPRIRARTLGEAAGMALLLAARVGHQGDLGQEFARGFTSAIQDDHDELRTHLVSHLDRAADHLERAVRDDPDAVVEACNELDQLLRRHPDLVTEVLRPLHLTYWEALDQIESGDE